jgi:hypothetical protein
MARKRPCRICRRWFAPHPRVGDRQRTCSSADCQRERHRRACTAWRRRHPDYDREDRLRRRLRIPAKATAGAPLRGIDWSAARDAVGLQVAVTIEETGQVLQEWARDAVSVQVTGPLGVRPQVPP